MTGGDGGSVFVSSAVTFPVFVNGSLRNLFVCFFFCIRIYLFFLLHKLKHYCIQFFGLSIPIFFLLYSHILLIFKKFHIADVEVIALCEIYINILVNIIAI